MRFYIKITRALTKLFKENKQKKQNESFIFKKIARQTFRQFIKIFMKMFMLIHFDFKNLIKIEINASKFIITAILSQFITFIIDIKQTQ